MWSFQSPVLDWKWNKTIQGRWLPGLSLQQRPLCSLPFAWTQAAQECGSPHGQWRGEHSGRQRGHHAEPLATNLLFICYFMKTARSRALSQELWFISMCVLVAESCPTLCDLMDYSPPDSSVHGIFQARTLEWVAILFSRGSFWLGDPTWVFCIAGRFLTIWATREAHLFQVPKLRLPVMFTSKRQLLLQGNKFTILPKHRGVGNQASGILRFWDKSQFAGEVSSYFSYFGPFGICIPVFHLQCLSLLEFVQLHALSVPWVWEEEFCEVMLRGNITVNTLALEALSPRNQRQQGRESSRAWTQSTY